MKPRWSHPASRELRQIQSYIAIDNQDAADRVVARIRERVGVLSTHPLAGREGQVAGTRELVLAGTPYIVVYSIEGHRVMILSILHAARQWPENF